MCSFVLENIDWNNVKKREMIKIWKLLAHQKFQKIFTIDHSADEISKCENFKHFDKLDKSKIALILTVLTL